MPHFMITSNVIRRFRYTDPETGKNTGYKGRTALHAANKCACAILNKKKKSGAEISEFTFELTETTANSKKETVKYKSVLSKPTSHVYKWGNSLMVRYKLKTKRAQDIPPETILLEKTPQIDDNNINSILANNVAYLLDDIPVIVI